MSDWQTLAVFSHLDDHEWCAGHACNVDQDPTACPMYRDDLDPELAARMKASIDRKIEEDKHR